MMNLQDRIDELTKLKDENDLGLMKNKQILERLKSDIQAGEMRDIAITNRLDELSSLEN